MKMEPISNSLGREDNPRTHVYIDGFNLYYSSLRNAPQYKWLDLAALCRLLLPRHEIQLIRYFTAPVKASLGSPGSESRQQAYWRALKTIQNLVRHDGQFQINRVVRELVEPPESGPRRVFVNDTKEKGSDVNLATYLLVDGFRDDYDVAVVISNDSDLVLPVTMVRDVLHKSVGVVIPLPVQEQPAGTYSSDDDSDLRSARRPSKKLCEAATFFKTIRRNALAQAQFPDVVTDRKGRITRPVAWRAETEETKAGAAPHEAAPRPTDEAVGDVL